jgi:hypothetical protein
MRPHEWGTRHPAALKLEVEAGDWGSARAVFRAGFVTGRRVTYYREPVEDALLMRLDLVGDE